MKFLHLIFLFSEHYFRNRILMLTDFILRCVKKEKNKIKKKKKERNLVEAETVLEDRRQH